MTAIAEICAMFSLVVSEKKTIIIRMRPPSMKADVVDVEARGQRYTQVEPFVYLGGKLALSAMPSLHNRNAQVWACFYKDLLCIP